MSNGYLTSCALAISIIITLVLFVKKGIGNLETKIFKRMLICNVLESLTTTAIVMVALTINSNIIFSLLNRIDVILIILWCSLIFYYMYTITTKDIKKSVKIFIFIVNSFIIILSLFLDVKIINHNGILNSTGPLTYLGLFGAIFYITLMMLTLLITKNKKKGIDKKKYIPLYFLILLLICVAVLRTIIPEINFISILLSIVDLIMIFTIENPDLKMVNELLRNRELVEEQMEDKSDFLFEMSQGIKIPTKNILELTKTYEKVNEDIDKKDVVRLIRSNAEELIFRTNNILDVSSMDASKIKIEDKEYVSYTLFNEVKALINNKLNNKKVTLNFKINNNIPNKLSGDFVRLKQILISFLMNSVENTKDGYINVNVDSITRYDVARLIIRIEDTGTGMSIEQVNKVLDSSRNLNNDEIDKIDDLDIDIPVAIKMIKLMGGNINIRSTPNKGTIINLVIDQRYKLDDVSAVEKNIEKYSSDVFGRKRVLIVNDSKEEIFKIKTILSKYNYDVNTTMLAKECVDRVKSGELYNLIIIDDELRISSALSVLKELKTDKEFNIPVVVTLNQDKEHFKEDYKDEGFADYVLKENFSDDLERIISSYL